MLSSPFLEHNSRCCSTCLYDLSFRSFSLLPLPCLSIGVGPELAGVRGIWRRGCRCGVLQPCSDPSPFMKPPSILVPNFVSRPEISFQWWPQLQFSFVSSRTFPPPSMFRAQSIADFPAVSRIGESFIHLFPNDTPTSLAHDPQTSCNPSREVSSSNSWHPTMVSWHFIRGSLSEDTQPLTALNLRPSRISGAVAANFRRSDPILRERLLPIYGVIGAALPAPSGSISYLFLPLPTTFTIHVLVHRALCHPHSQFDCRLEGGIISQESETLPAAVTSRRRSHF